VKRERIMTKQRVLLATTATAALACGSAAAQSAGSWLVKAGVGYVTPDVDSGSLGAPSTPNTRIDIDNAAALVASVTYFYTEHLSVEAQASLPFKHDVTGAGAIAGAGRIATFKQMSPTVFGQWRFGAASASLRPYVGVGITWVNFFDEEGSGTLTALVQPGGPPVRLSIDSAFGMSPQVGLSIKLAERWMFDASVVKSYIKTTAKLSSGQAIDIDFDPLSVNLSVAYRF